MTLKKSFLGEILENLKRRKDVLAGVSIIFFGYSLMLYLRLSPVASAYPGFPDLSPELKEELLDRLMQRAADYLGVKPMLAVVFGLIGILMGINAFRWLHVKNKLDLYNSVPVSFTKRFLIIVFNSLIIVFVPMLICYILCLIILGAYGILNGAVASIFFGSLMLGFAFYVGVFSVTSLAVCLTGNIHTSIFGTVVLLGYEILIVVMIIAYMGRFFSTFPGWLDGAASFFVRPHFSVIMFMVEIIAAAEGLYEGGIMCGYRGERFSLLMDKTNSGHSVGFSLALMLLVAFGTLVLTWFLFKHRPAEAAGRSMALPKTKRIIKWLVMFPISILGAEAFMIFGGDYLFPYIMGFLLTAIIGCMLMEVIYESDIKCALKNVIDIPIVWIIGLTFVGIFALDAFGYDSYMPNVENLKGVIIDEDFMISGYDYESGCYMEKKDGTYYMVPRMQYWREHPLTGEKEIEAVVSMAKAANEARDSWEDKTYRLIGFIDKRGKAAYRFYAIPKEAYNKGFETIAKSREYTMLQYQGLYEMSDMISEINIVDRNRKWTDIYGKDVGRVTEALKKDMESRTFWDIDRRWPLGTVVLRVSRSSGGDFTYAYSFYDDFENTIRCLESLGITIDTTE